MDAGAHNQLTGPPCSPSPGALQSGLEFLEVCVSHQAEPLLEAGVQRARVQSLTLHFLAVRPKAIHSPLCALFPSPGKWPSFLGLP